MNHRFPAMGLAALAFAVPLAAILCARGADIADVTLPPGARAVWDVAKAERETTATRERICLNGLWRWQPAEPQSRQPPTGNWGFFKVPGCWPGITDYMQKDSQTVYAHPNWQGQKLSSLTAAWHQREFTVPTNWAGRRIALSLEYLNSFAAVFVDGQPAGEVVFPGGEADLTALCRPGATHRLSMLVVALPLKGVMLSYTDSASAREVKGSVARRGLCGDVFLVSSPLKPALTDVRVETSVRNGHLGVDAALAGLESNAAYSLRARVTSRPFAPALSPDGGEGVVKEFRRPLQAGDLKNGRVAITEDWLPDKLWDLHTPQHQYQLEVSLLDARGKVLDQWWSTRFGFREFWIEGRDFQLNGSRLHLSVIPLDNAQVSARLASYASARESLERLKAIGINCVYTHNYGCEPGAHLGFAEILKAADEVGMLVAFSLPHFSHYDWVATGADRNNGYARHAAFYVRAAQNHPSVVMYSMSHNATGYSEDMNPDLMDGLKDVRDSWALRNSKSALRAEAIAHGLDPSRLVYHHASGNLGSMHQINFYPNFVPIQELSDWFGHWATTGVKPLFLCEYGAPFTWDWTMYRGWYQGKREFGSAVVPWEFCLAEWNAQFLGDRAYQISEAETANLRWEARQFRDGKVWHRWDYPHHVGSTVFDERYPVFAAYLTDNWRAFRTWGVSAISPWEHGHFWKLRDGVDKRRREFATDWDKLQRPGFSPDYEEQRYERMDLAFERSDWLTTPASEALLRNNRPLLAYLAGKPTAFTSKDHNFVAGETVEKQIIVLNDSRQTVGCECRWSLGLPQPLTGSQNVTVPPGQQARLPLRFELPAALSTGRYELTMNARFSTGETREDRFVLNVLPKPPPPATNARIAVFDPQGETRALLGKLGLKSAVITAEANLAGYDLLVIGKAALTADGPAPDLGRVRQGLKVVVFEQTAEALEQRLGFRVAEYGLRQVFPRVADHPALAALTAEQLRDWRGEATILPLRLKYESSRQFNGAPTVQWCGLPVTRLWRCGNRGNVASVLIEKPPRGNFLPIADGGYSLQYAPLLEYREGNGLVLFCQMDVTGRTESDPAAETLARNLLQYVFEWKPGPQRKALYAGAPAGKSFLESAGFTVGAYDGGPLARDQVLILSHGSGPALANRATVIADWLKGGGKVLALGLDQAEANVLLPFKVGMKNAEHIAAWFPPMGMVTPLAGVAPADVHNRDPRPLPLVVSGARIIGNGVLAQAENANAVFCQLEPWQFDPKRSMNLKRTFRRTAFLTSRLLGNLGVSASTPLLERFGRPVAGPMEKRWLNGLYLDQPEEWDDPYRFFRW